MSVHEPSDGIAENSNAGSSSHSPRPPSQRDGQSRPAGEAVTHARRESAERARQLEQRIRQEREIATASLEPVFDDAWSGRPFPRRFFPWLKNVLAHRALDHVRLELSEDGTRLPYDWGIKSVLDVLLAGEGREAHFFVSRGSPAHAAWLRTLDLPRLFALADEYATYARTSTACERAVERFPDRQRQVI